LNLPVTYLRIVSKDDLDKVFSWENNPEFWEFSASSGPYSEQEVVQFIEECQNLNINGQCRFMIVDHLDTAIGALDVFEYDSANKTAGIGILIANAALRNKGFAKSALKNFLQVPETKKDLRLVWCLVHMDNIPSQKLFESCGFTISGKKLYRGKEALRYTFYI
jgi:diamine N-acetyltransferase